MSDPRLTPAQSPTLGRPTAKRIGAIDGLRGLFLVLMTLTHVQTPGGSILKAFHPDTISFVDSAYGFVFLSGLMAGLVYTRVADRRGFAAAVRRMSVRALQLYGWALALVLGIALVAALSPEAGAAWRTWAGPLTRPDLRVIAAAALLLQEASFADVLPMYAVFLIVGQAALWLCLRGRTTALIIGSVLLWAAVQVGASIPLTHALDSDLARLRPDLGLPRESFNLFAWQLPFIGGLAIGVHAARGRLNLAAIFPSRSAAVLWLCLAGLASIAVTVVALRLNHPGAHAPGSAEWLLLLYTVKERVGMGCLLNVLLFAYPMAWLLIAGPQAGSVWLRGAASAFSAVINAACLRLLGRHSLQVYVWQVVLVYGLKVLDGRLGHATPLLNAGLIIATLGLLAVPALLRERLGRPRSTLNRGPEAVDGRGQISRRRLATDDHAAHVVGQDVFAAEPVPSVAPGRG